MLKDKARQFVRRLQRPHWAGITLALAALLALTFEPSPMRSMEHAWYDLLWSMDSAEPSGAVALIAIDDRSLDALGPRPWPRSLLAAGISKLSALEPSAIVLDEMLESRDWNPAHQELLALDQDIEDPTGALKNPAYEPIRQRVKSAIKDTDEDALLVEAASQATRLVLPLEGAYNSPALDQWIVQALKHSSIEPLGEGPGLADSIKHLSNPAQAYCRQLPDAPRLRYPFKALASSALALGHRDFFPDNENMLRQQPLFLSHQGRLYPSLALQMALARQGKGLTDARWVRLSNGLDAVSVGSLTVQAQRCGMGMMLAPPAAYGVHSFSDLMQGRLAASDIKGKAVLIGIVTSSEPRHRLPSGAMATRAQLTASLADQILRSDQRGRPAWAYGAECVGVLYFACFVALVFPRFSDRQGLLMLALCLAPWVLLCLTLYYSAGLWIYAMTPALVGLLGAGYWLYEIVLGISREGASQETESHRALALSFQSQGMLDHAYEHFLKCPLDDQAIRAHLYNLGTEFERKRMYGKAVALYEHLLTAVGPYSDIAERIARLRALEGSMRAPSAPQGQNMSIHKGAERPTLGRYELIKELGRGAMGTVYLGRDPKINRHVAIKTLRYDELGSHDAKGIKERFFKEAEAAGKLSHPNIVAIYDVGEDQDVAYLAMEFLEGRCLTDFCKPSMLLPPPQGMRIVGSVAQALDYAHRNGVVHRDIKPANIMLLKSGAVKVTDFGVARVADLTRTQTGIIMGTPGYMSPEQVTGKPVTGQSDIFSLGALMYELLSGQRPFEAEGLPALMYAITHTDPRPIEQVATGLHPCACAIVTRALSKDLKTRYPTGSSMAADIAACLKQYH